jgi:hypothetical protein
MMENLSMRLANGNSFIYERKQESNFAFLFFMVHGPIQTNVKKNGVNRDKAVARHKGNFTMKA